MVASNQQVFRTILKRWDAILQNYKIFFKYLYLIKITKTMNAPISFKTTSQVFFYKASEIFNLFYRLLRYFENTFGHLRPLLRGWPLTLDWKNLGISHYRKLVSFKIKEPSIVRVQSQNSLIGTAKTFLKIHVAWCVKSKFLRNFPSNELQKSFRSNVTLCRFSRIWPWRNIFVQMLRYVDIQGYWPEVSLIFFANWFSRGPNSFKRSTSVQYCSTESQINNFLKSS